jgi:hypothetical protein
MLILFLRGDIVEKDIETKDSGRFWVQMPATSARILEGNIAVMRGDTVKYKEKTMENAFLRWQWLRRQFGLPHEGL